MGGTHSKIRYEKFSSNSKSKSNELAFSYFDSYWQCERPIIVCKCYRLHCYRFHAFPYKVDLDEWIRRENEGKEHKEPMGITEESLYKFYNETVLQQSRTFFRN